MIDSRQIFKYRIKLIKQAGALPIHELRVKLQEILLNSKLPFEWTKSGPRLVLGPGEKQTDIQSDCQYVDIYFNRDIREHLIEQELGSLLQAEGYEIIETEQIPYNLCSVESLAKYVCYEASPIALKGDLPKELLMQVNDKVVNLRSFIKGLKALGDNKIEIIIELSALRSIGIEQMLMKLPCLEVKSTGLKLKRKALLWEDSKNALRQI